MLAFIHKVSRIYTSFVYTLHPKKIGGGLNIALFLLKQPTGTTVKLALSQQSAKFTVPYVTCVSIELVLLTLKDLYSLHMLVQSNELTTVYS